MKKTIAFIMLLLSVCVFASCGGNGSNAKTVGLNEEITYKDFSFKVLGAAFLRPELDADKENDTLLFRVNIKNNSDTAQLFDSDIFSLEGYEKQAIKFEKADAYIDADSAQTLSVGFKVPATLRSVVSLNIAADEKRRLSVDLSDERIAKGLPVIEYSQGDSVAVREIFVKVTGINSQAVTDGTKFTLDLFIKNNATGAGVNLLDKNFKIYDKDFNEYSVAERTLADEISYTGDTQGTLTYSLPENYVGELYFTVSREIKAEDIRGILLNTENENE